MQFSGHVYVVRNHNGMYFRHRGRSARRSTWTSDLTLASYFSRLARARRCVSICAIDADRRKSTDPVPTIVEIEPREVGVIDHGARAAMAVKKARSRSGLKCARRAPTSYRVVWQTYEYDDE